MAKYSITIESDDAAELRKILGVEASTLPKLETKVEKPVEKKTAAKAEKKAAPAAKVEEPAAEDDEFSELNDEPTITLQQVTDKLIAYGRRFGKPDMIKLLGTFGVKTSKDLRGDQYAELIEKIDDALAKK